MKLVLTFCFIFVSFMYSSISQAQSSVFTTQILTQLKQEYQGQRWLMLMWSVDCPPCMKELALVNELRNKKQDLAVVIVNTDANEESIAQSAEILKKFKVDDLANYYFAVGQSDQSRYLIDPSWYGELPRSYFVDESARFHGKSGLVAKTFLSKWLL